ncbi:hypothetical protein VTO42DRAFT_6026 [Malbranchea cinnamomea]
MSRLDQIVKGTPPPEADIPFSSISRPPSSRLSQSHQHDDSETPATPTPDPLSILPSSPPQIYLNLLILEGSLRSQYLALRDRRRQNTFFLLLLALWIAYFSYALFLRPREDGSGVGGSVYWVVEMGEKVALMGGIVTAILVWGTGQWERGIRWPRRWLGVTNRGLRGINAKVVVIRGPWWKEMLSLLAFLFPYTSFFPSSTSFHYVERPREKGRHSPYGQDDYACVEEDLAPGGDYIRLLLLPKAFSPAFRENWDEYRTEYWERENERRSRLRQKIKERERQIAKQEGGWLWWLGWRGWKRRKPAGRDLEKSHHGLHSRHATARHGTEKGSARPRRGTGGGTPPKFGDSHSRTSSRSTTPNPFSDVDDKGPASDRERSHRGSTVEKERRKKRLSVSGSSASGRAPSPLSQIDRNLAVVPDDRFLKPDK